MHRYRVKAFTAFVLASSDLSSLPNISALLCLDGSWLVLVDLSMTILSACL